MPDLGIGSSGKRVAMKMRCSWRPGIYFGKVMVFFIFAVAIGWTGVAD